MCLRGVGRKLWSTLSDRGSPIRRRSSESSTAKSRRGSNTSTATRTATRRSTRFGSAARKFRAALRLVRGALSTYSAENAHYRDVARRVSEIRDAQALVETFDDHVTPAAGSAATPDEDVLADVRSELVDRRETVAPEGNVEDRLESVRADLVEGRERVDGLPIATDGFDAVAGGPRTSYRRARDRMAEAYEEPGRERFHEWRKRVKYHRCHSRLLRNVWVGPMKARRSELKTPSDLIGDEHDLAVFLSVMHEEELFGATTREALEDVVRGRRSQLQRRGRPVGERLFAEQPDRLVARLRRYWDATREHEA
jgi:CHAD domain-containing protein